MRALRLQWAPHLEGLWVAQVNVNLFVRTDEDFFNLIYRPHSFDVNYDSLVRTDFIDYGVFCTADEAKALLPAFEKIFDFMLSHTDKHKAISLGDKDYDDFMECFNLLWAYCSGEEVV